MSTTDDEGQPPPAASAEPAAAPFTFDRHLVLDQLGGWRGMVDATLPTLAFIVANGVAGLRTGVWAALVSALLVFLLRLVRRGGGPPGHHRAPAPGVAAAPGAAGRRG